MKRIVLLASAIAMTASGAAFAATTTTKATAKPAAHATAKPVKLAKAHKVKVDKSKKTATPS